MVRYEHDSDYALNFRKLDVVPLVTLSVSSELCIMD